jgi:hypothetical protein
VHDTLPVYVIECLNHSVNVKTRVIKCHQCEELAPRLVSFDGLSDHRGDPNFAVNHNVDQLWNTLLTLHLSQDLQFASNSVCVDRFQKFDHAKIATVADRKKNVRIMAAANPLCQFVSRNVTEDWIPVTELPVIRPKIQVNIRVHVRDVRVIEIETVANTSI